MVRIRTRTTDLKGHWEKIFPHLATDSNWKIHSPQDINYNCFSWAAGITDHPWDPENGDWPDNCARELSVTAFLRAYETLGYNVEKSERDAKVVERVAIYAVGEVPKHAARQQPDGVWTSKFGMSFDVLHSLEGLNDGDYGAVAFILERDREKIE